MAYKQPVSILLVIHTPDLQVLLLERKDFTGGWQSVTGSRENDEDLMATARRELFEETGIEASPGSIVDWHFNSDFEIYERWRHRYAPGVTVNTEHVFSIELPAPCDIRLAPKEHSRFCWVDWQLASTMVFSPSNAEAIRKLGERGRRGRK